MTSDKTEIVYGKHAVRHCLETAPEAVLELWVQDNKRMSKSMLDILALAQDIRAQAASREALDKLSGYGRHQGLVLRRKPLHIATSDLETFLSRNLHDNLLLLVLDSVQDPHNLGACLRTADAAGVDAVILPRDKSVAITPAVRKVASGAAETVPVIIVANLARALQQLRDHGIWTLGTADGTGDSLYDLDLRRSLAIVMGAEGEGLRRNTREHCDMLARLPMVGRVESLNVSVAAGICLYEAVRQRRAGR